MDKKKGIIVVLGLIIVGLVVWTILKNGELRYAGTIEATEVDISAQVASTIAGYDVKEGDSVTNNRVLVRLSGEDIKLAAAAAESDFARAEKLYKSGTIPLEAYDHLRVKRDDLALRAAWCTVKAPLAGTVLDTYHEAGEWVTPGVKLLTIGDLSSVWAIFYAPQPSLARISLGMDIKGALPEMPGRQFSGKVTHIASEAEFTPKNVQTRKERTRLVYAIKVTFDNSDGMLKPGMTLETALPD